MVEQPKVFLVFFRKNLMIVLSALIALAGVSGSAAGQDCIYKDEFGEPVIHVGALALAGFFSLLGSGSELGIPEDYEAWDLNGDGIPDKVQFTLLTEILCTSGIAEHPTVDFDEIREAFEDNVAQYWTMINSLMGAEAALIAGAPDLYQVGVELGNAAIAAGIYDDPLPPEAFIGGVLPEPWIGATWKDLRYALKDTGDTVDEYASMGLIGSPTAAIWLMLNNPAMAYILAAIWGLDSAFTASFFEAELFDVMGKVFAFQQLDWSYILGVLFPYGLTPTTAVNAQNSIAALGLDESLLPDVAALAITSGGEEALHASVLWGETSLLDLYFANGGDFAMIWAEIITQLPGLPVSSNRMFFLLTVSLAIAGAVALGWKRKILKRHI